MEKDNSYKSILKGISFFGGAQVFQILINLVRGKFVAMLLGPEGMGISSLLTASSNTIQQIAQAGLPTAIVKEVSEAKEGSPNHISVDEVISATRTAVLTTASIGTVICIVFSALLSRWTFGNDTFTWQYVVLSIAVMFSMLGSGEMSILQGLHQVKRLSWASVVGASTGLAVGVPLYYFFGNDGIVPGMIAVSAASYIFYRTSAAKATGRLDTKIAWHIRKFIIRKLVTLGLVLMAGSLIGTLVTYLTNTFVRYIGGIDDVGYFQAANSITNQYAGIVFAAMSVDYFPRLVAVASDNAKMAGIVNRQMEIVSLIMAPLMIALMFSAPLLIRILLTSKFECVIPLIHWLSLGIFLRALIFPAGYITFAKDNKRLFFLLEGVFGNVIGLTANCICYYTWGLTGLGISMCIAYTISFVVYFAVNRHYYSYGIGRGTARVVLITLSAVVLPFFATFVQSGFIYCLAMSAVLIATSAYSLRMLVKNIKRQ